MVPVSVKRLLYRRRVVERLHLKAEHPKVLQKGSYVDDNRSASRLLLQSDEIVSRAEVLFKEGESTNASSVLQSLRFGTVDENVVSRTDAFISLIARGRRVIATSDSKRQPLPGELVIIYGNYPCCYDNLLINNPVRRHVSSFFEINHDDVEFDYRWGAVERIFIINADQRIDRYDSVLRELARAHAPLDRITRISACMGEIGPTPTVSGTIGSVRSHVNALHAVKEQAYGNVLILEDDFCFTDDIDSHLDDLNIFMSAGYDYSVCLLATSKYGLITPFDELVSLSKQDCTNATAYLVSSKHIDTVIQVAEESLKGLLETFDCPTYALDRYWRCLQESNRFLVFRKKFGFQTASFSNIEKVIVRYLD
jgi:hypothetical protein